MPLMFTTMPSGSGVSSPVANSDRRRCASSTGGRLGSPVIDARRRLGRGSCRWAAAARPWRRFRPGSGSGEGRVNARKQVAVPAPAGPREGA
jgi:hypothetical protein